MPEEAIWFFVGSLVESVFHRVWLLPFNKVELAGEGLCTSGGPQQRVNLDSTLHICDFFLTAKEFQLFQEANMFNRIMKAFCFTYRFFFGEEKCCEKADTPQNKSNIKFR